MSGQSHPHDHAGEMATDVLGNQPTNKFQVQRNQCQEPPGGGIEPIPVALDETDNGSQPKDDAQRPWVDLLERELSELDTLIGLQQRKVQVLQDLREQALAGRLTGLSDGAVRVPLAQLLADGLGDPGTTGEARYSAIQSHGESLPARPPLPPETRGQLPLREGALESYLVAQARVPLRESPVVEVAIVSFRTPAGRAPPQGRSRGGSPRHAPLPGYIHVLAVTYRDGTVAFFDTAGEALCTYDSGHRGLVAVGHDALDDPLLVTAAADGTVRIHSMTLWYGGRRVAAPRGGTGSGKGPGKGPGQQQPQSPEAGAPIAGESSPPRPVGPPPSALGLGLEVKFVADLHPAGGGGKSFEPPPDPPRVTAVGAYFNRGVGRAITYAADAAGSMHFHLSNGSWLGEAASPELRPVPAVRRTGMMLAYAAGSNVEFLSSVSREHLPRATCTGSANVTALAVDALSAGQLYAGLSTGLILVFDTRHRDPSTGAASCKLTGTLPLPAKAVGPITSLATIRGYLLASTPTMLAAYNTTVMGPEGGKLLFAQSLIPAGAPDCTEQQQGGGGGHDVKLGVAYTGFFRGGEQLVAALGPCDKEVTIYQALLPYDPHDWDISWLRGPVIIAGLVMVVLVQVMRKGRGARSKARRRERANLGRTGYGSGRGSDGAANAVRDEMEALTSKIRQLERLTDTPVRGADQASRSLRATYASAGDYLDSD